VLPSSLEQVRRKLRERALVAHDKRSLLGELKLYGMRSAYDDVMTAGIKRQHEPPRIVGDLLKSEIAEKQARSIKYQMTIAKLPLAKDIDEFAFDSTPINETLVRDLSNGAFLAEQRNAVLIGGTGTGKSHLAIAIARACIRGGARERFYNVVDLVNRLESETRAGRQGRMADYLSRLDFVVLDELGYLPFAQGRWTVALPPRQPALRTHLHHRHHQSRLCRMAQRLWRRQDDDGAPGSPHPSLRDRGDRQRKLAVQTPRLTSG
jgi:DNA replication protein DnaC